MLAWLSRACPVCLRIHGRSVKLLWNGGLAGALLGEQPAPTKPTGSVSLGAVTWALVHPLVLEQAMHLLLRRDCGLFWAWAEGHSKPAPPSCRTHLGWGLLPSRSVSGCVPQRAGWQLVLITLSPMLQGSSCAEALLCPGAYAQAQQRSICPL